MIITDTPGSTFGKIAIDIVGPHPITKLDKEYIYKQYRTNLQNIY